MMYTYYIATRPETVVSMVLNGKFPDGLPEWLEPKQIICCDSARASISTSQTSHDQTFILELTLTTPLISEALSYASGSQGESVSVKLKQIDIRWINKILVYSLAGQKLLTNLFKGQCPKCVEIKPEFYQAPEIKDTISSPSRMHTTALIETKIVSPNKRKNDSDSSHCAKLQKGNIHSTVSSQQELFVEGLTKIPIVSDGHCFYRAVTYYLTKEEDIGFLRKIIAANLEHNIDQYRRFISLPIGRTIEEYIADIRSTNTWAGDLELTILMRLLDRPIVVIGPNCMIRNQNEIVGFEGEPIFVYYDGINHYDALVLDGTRDARDILTNSTQVHEHSPQKAAKKESVFAALERIGTLEEHLQLLKSAFLEAKETILITSYYINRETLDKAGLYKLIIQARQRHVKLYFYYNDKYILESTVEDFFAYWDVYCYATYTHSKILAVDSHLVILGSFNWLSCIDSRYPLTNDASIICRGNICHELKESLWDYLKYYRNLQFENKREIEYFLQDRDSEASRVWEVERNTTLNYLPTLDQHLGFFQTIFEIAQRYIIICSPFTSPDESYKEDMDYSQFQRALQRGVKIFFVCRADDCYLPAFVKFIEPFIGKNIFLLQVDNFHNKTIVMDDELIAEGSFNWLSASRDEYSNSHNHETTLIVRGNMARDLIQHFYQSCLGRDILAVLKTLNAEGKCLANCVTRFTEEQTGEQKQSSTQNPRPL